MNYLANFTISNNKKTSSSKNIGFILNSHKYALCDVNYRISNKKPVGLLHKKTRENIKHNLDLLTALFKC